EGIPFWDALLLVARRRQALSPRVLSEVGFHQEQSSKRLVLSRAEVLNGALREITCDPDPVAVLSRVVVNGGVRHLPLLDFRCIPEEVNVSTIVDIASQIAPGPFIILETLRSYHLAGASLLTFEELAAFLGRANLFGPFVDRAYVAHQLIDG